MDPIDPKDGVEFDAVSRFRLSKSSSIKEAPLRAPQPSSPVSRYFFSAFAAGRTGFSLSRCMLM